MIIRKAEVKDAEAISKIHALSWKKAYQIMLPQAYLDDLRENFWTEAFENWISNDHLTVKIIFDDELPVGCIAYGRSRDEKKPQWGEIVSVYVLPEYYGKGFGSQLMINAIKDMREMGFENLYLWVLNENRQAQMFYEKHGFVKTEDQLSFEIAGETKTDARYIYRMK